MATWDGELLEMLSEFIFNQERCTMINLVVIQLKLLMCLQHHLLVFPVAATEQLFLNFCNLNRPICLELLADRYQRK